MQCPRCKADLPERCEPPEGRGQNDADPRPGAATPPGAVAPADALRVESPPAPCPQCGWSAMWNE